MARTRSAEAERDAAHHSLAALQNRIVFQVAEAYYRLFQARELVKVREEGLFSAVARGVFADVKRPDTGGRGLSGVVPRAEGYLNPILAALEGRA